MKHIFQFFIACGLCIITLSHSMEQLGDTNSLLKCSSVVCHDFNPQEVHYITDNTALIRDWGKYKSVDFTTKNHTEIVSTPCNIQHTFLHPKKNILASSLTRHISSEYDMYYNKKEYAEICIYNIETQKELKKITIKNKPACLVLDSSNPALFFSYQNVENEDILQQYNYETDATKEHIISKLRHFASHPNKNELCITCSQEKPALYETNNFTITKTMSLGSFMQNVMSYYTLCQYNFDGSCVALGDGNLIFIWDIRANKAFSLPVAVTNALPDTKILFHPNNVVLAVLSKSSWRSIIRLWNIFKRECLTEMDFPNQLVEDISFSPDGTKIIMILKRESRIYILDQKIIDQ